MTDILFDSRRSGRWVMDSNMGLFPNARGNSRKGKDSFFLYESYRSRSSARRGNDRTELRTIDLHARDRAGLGRRPGRVPRSSLPQWPRVACRSRRLLAAHDRLGGAAPSPIQPEPTRAPLTPSAEDAGSAIGPYKLLVQIGEGGMGVVWMAEQKEPIQRRVALKVIKAGMDSKQVLARFEAERQALEVGIPM